MSEPPIKKTAVIFDVQSLSVNDGPGTRTAVFFKGCPLNCLWCHNPESKSQKPQIMYYKNLCCCCMLCASACKNGAQIIGPDKTHEMVHDKCINCGRCLEVCCYEAIRSCGRTYSPSDLYERIKSDIACIKEHGGITFTGGEPLLHAEFIKDFCALIPGVHTAMETSGYTERETLEKIIKCIDLFLFDIKFIDNIEHKKYCEADNRKILSNLDYLYGREKEIILRLPLIPGINDTSQHIEEVSQLIKKYPKIKSAQIMPYNNFGKEKMHALGMKIPDEPPRIKPGKETIKNWLQEFIKRGCMNISCS